MEKSEKKNCQWCLCFIVHKSIRPCFTRFLPCFSSFCFSLPQIISVCIFCICLHLPHPFDTSLFPGLYFSPGCLVPFSFSWFWSPSFSYLIPRSLSPLRLSVGERQRGVPNPLGWRKRCAGLSFPPPPPHIANQCLPFSSGWAPQTGGSISY